MSESTSVPLPTPALAGDQDPNAALGQGKKRKRTGKEREERKRLAILAQKEAEEAAKNGTAPADQDQVTAGNNETGATAEPKAPQVVDLEKVASRIPQALKTLHPIFKQAKTFETRRLIKKIKFLRTKGDTKSELAELEGQLSIFHNIQLHPLAQSHLLVKLRKQPQLKHSTVPQSLVDLLTPSEPSLPPTSSSSTPALVGKVENRLCSAKNVADGVKNVLSWVLGEEGVKLGQTAAKVKAKAQMHNQANDIPSKGDSLVQAKYADESDDDDVAVELDGGRGKEMLVGSGGEEDSDDDDEGRQQDFAADAAGWESGSVNGDDLDGEGNDSEPESESDTDAIAIRLTKKSKTASAPLPVPVAAKAKAATSKVNSSKPSKEAITSSTFLPSLATGFTRGDSDDSDPDMDFDPDGVIGKQGVVRKNRRGQRARQAIWEKKYGKNAKHVVKARTEDESKALRENDKRGKPEGMKSRDAGWAKKDSISTAGAPAAATANVGGASFSYQPKSTYAAPATASAGRSYSSAPTPAAPQAGAPNLHPSWEAARLRKQKMAAIPAAGAKIVFD